MSGRSALAVAIALAGCTAPAQVGARALPADVAAFVERRDACDHFRGEEPYDAARAAELKTKLAETCTGTDAALAALRRKYSGNRQVIERLSGYDGQIE
ncbi:hypothetical protein [Sphingomonas segetis]|jgi:hypothetical protein|uniref:hypothetical protein n=1 Tax=Sphingomonas segetis TaxID=1104779 RepID=UPI0018AD4FB2|nr:hypothetical protein [Sphingomonas segetis]